MGGTIELYHFSELPWTLQERTYVQVENGFFKPTGLWLSDERRGDGWSDWCKSEEFGLNRLKHKTRILVNLENVKLITNEQEIEEFQEEFKWEVFESIAYIKWNEVKKQYKGIIITPYLWRSRLGRTWYYGWDCASGCIWDLSSIESWEPENEPV